MSDDIMLVSLRLIENYLFEIDFGEFGNFMGDEPEPLGGGEGPNPERMLASAVANCLCASLLFAVRKFKGEPRGLEAKVKGSTTRVDKRLRIEKLQVEITLDAGEEDLPNVARALEQFEDFCVVTQSVRHGIPVEVAVRNAAGELLHSGGEASA